VPGGLGAGGRPRCEDASEPGRNGRGGREYALLDVWTGTEPEKSLAGSELNCCSIKAHSTLYCIHFRLGEALVGLHGIRSGRRGLSPARPTAGSVPASGCFQTHVATEVL
jgi:hypothetical protein